MIEAAQLAASQERRQGTSPPFATPTQLATSSPFTLQGQPWLFTADHCASLTFYLLPTNEQAQVAYKGIAILSMYCIVHNSKLGFCLVPGIWHLYTGVMLASNEQQHTTAPHFWLASSDILMFRIFCVNSTESYIQPSTRTSITTSEKASASMYPDVFPMKNVSTCNLNWGVF